MAVNTTKKVEGSSPAAAPAAKIGTPITKPQPQVDRMLLELKKVKRYHHNGRLFVAGEAYRVTQVEAQALLQLTFNNRPVFTRYRPKVDVERVKSLEGPIIRDLTSVTDGDSTSLQPIKIPNSSLKPQSISLDDDPDFLQSLSEGAGNPDDDGQGLEDEDGEGED